MKNSLDYNNSRLIFFLFATLLFFNQKEVFSQILLEKYFHPNGNRALEAGDIISTSDGGILLLSQSKEGINGCTESGSLYLFKMNNQGQVQWQNRISYQRGLEGAKLHESNGYYFILANVWFGVGGPGEVFIKIDTTGNIIGSTKYSLANAINTIITSNDKIILAGDYITTLDFNGNVIYSNQYLYNSTPIHIDLCTEADNGSLLLSNERTFPTYQSYIIKIDSSGNVMWSKVLDINLISNIKYHDNKIYITGSDSIYGFISIYDSNGNNISTSLYTNGSYGYLSGVEFKNNGNLIAHGFSINFEEDLSGNILWSHLYTNDLPNTSYRLFNKILPLTDGSILSLYRYQNDSLGCHSIGFSKTDGTDLTNCGAIPNQIYKSSTTIIDSAINITTTVNNTVLDSSILISNVGAQGQLLTICPGLSAENLIEVGPVVYPNPNFGSFYLNLNSVVGNGTIKIYNALGYLQEEIQLKNSTQIYEIFLEPGVFYISILSNNKFFSKKVVCYSF